MKPEMRANFRGSSRKPRCAAANWPCSTHATGGTDRYHIPMCATAQATVGLRRIRVGVVIAVVAAAAFVAWLLFSGADDKASSKSKAAAPVAASAQDLRDLASSIGHPIYWAGNKPSSTYELTQTKRGDVYIRYLPPGVRLGDPKPDFLTVGTYPYPHAFTTVQKLAKRKGEFNAAVADGGIAIASKARQRSVYFAYPGLDYMFEVYHPNPKRARSLAVSGQVRPVP